jgi:Trk K+ transport system NAD-binding subunit
VVVHQLVLANAGRAGTAIVVLADGDPAELSEDARSLVDDRLGSRIVFRSGDATRPADLELVRLGEARSVIVLAEEGESDARAVKIVLAVGVELGGFDGVPVVVELADPAIGARLVEACGTSVHPIVATQAVARTAAFALRRPGLGRIVGELFDFRGCDIHIRDETDLVGSTFAAVVPRVAKARPIGMIGPDGAVELNPPPETPFEEGDRLVVIADDVGPLMLADRGQGASSPPRTAGHGLMLDPAPGEEHLLVVGWNRLGAELLGSWATFAAPTSTVEIGFDDTVLDVGEIVVPGLDGSRLTVTAAASVTHLVDRPSTGAAPTTIVFLAYTERLTDDEADARTLLELRILHRTLATQGGEAPRIVVELLDVDNVPLAELSGPDDHLVSQAVGSQFIAQLAEQPERRAVFLQLYAADGPSLHLVPAADLGLAGDLGTADNVAAA